MNPQYTEPQLFRREVIIRRLVKEVVHWYKLKGTPIRMQVLAGKYARQLRDLGGFPEVVDELVSSGLIRVDFLDSGARVVYPRKWEEQQTLGKISGDTY